MNDNSIPNEMYPPNGYRLGGNEPRFVVWKDITVIARCEDEYFGQAIVAAHNLKEWIKIFKDSEKKGLDSYCEEIEKKLDFWLERC